MRSGEVLHIERLTADEAVLGQAKRGFAFAEVADDDVEQLLGEVKETEDRRRHCRCQYWLLSMRAEVVLPEQSRFE